jgi:hypothetical protein
MKLSTAFQKAWHEVETAFKDQRIKCHDLFAFVFCKAMGEGVEGALAQYDGRRHSNSKFRPNFFVWQGAEDPYVLFIGKLRFKPEEPSFIQSDIKVLMKYAHESSIDVLAPASSGKGSIVRKMNVSPDIETGYFIIGDFDSKEINQSINSCKLSPQAKAKLHVAIGAGSDEQKQFQYHSSIDSYTN